MAQFGVTDAGLLMPRLNDYLDLFENDFDVELAARGLEPPDYQKDAFFGALRAVLSARWDSLSEIIIQIDSGYDLNNATGVQLENLCSLIGITRRPATRSTVELTLDGTTGTTIPARSLVETVDGVRFRTTEDLTLTAGVDTVIAESVDFGPIAASAGELSQIVTPVDGWDSTTNALAASLGSPAETDPQLRRRRQASLQLGSAQSTAGIRAAILNLAWVTAATVIDNPTSATAVVDGVSLPAKSLSAVVYPDTPTADQIDELVEAIAGTAPAGIEQVGTNSDTFTYDSGYVTTIRWNYAVEITVDINAALTLEAGASQADVEANITEAIEDYFAGVAVGEDIKEVTLFGRLSQIDGIREVEVTFDAAGATPPASGDRSVTINSGEIAVIGSVVFT